VNWNDILKKKISVVLIGKDSKLESYCGIVLDVSDDFMTLNTQLNGNFLLDKIIFRTSLIQSVWIFKESGHVDKAS
jgi:hypothetical protein